MKVKLLVMLAVLSFTLFAQEFPKAVEGDYVVHYDPAGKLDQIQAYVMFVNSADDVINPPELGIAEQEIKKVKRGKFVLLPITDQTHGHGTHSQPAVWKPYLEQLLTESQR
jgi:homoserine O-acetyltransferase/O-succinyltransferase